MAFFEPFWVLNLSNPNIEPSGLASFLTICFSFNLTNFLYLLFYDFLTI